MFKIEYFAVIKFFCKDGLTSVQIKRVLGWCRVYSVVKEWVKLFKLGFKPIGRYHF